MPWSHQCQQCQLGTNDHPAVDTWLSLIYEAILKGYSMLQRHLDATRLWLYRYWVQYPSTVTDFLDPWGSQPWLHTAKLHTQRGSTLQGETRPSDRGMSPASVAFRLSHNRLVLWEHRPTGNPLACLTTKLLIGAFLEVFRSFLGFPSFLGNKLLGRSCRFFHLGNMA